MKAVFTSFGSTGDIQPFLALALEFRRRGHHPVLALSPNFRGRARELDIEFAPIGPELEPALIRGVGATLVREANPAEQVRHFLNALTPSVDRMYGELAAISRGAGCMVSSPFQLAARMLHDRFRIPYVSIHMSQFGALGSKIIKDVSAPMINACRARQGLSPLDDPLGADGASPQLALYAVSSRVLRAPASWPAHHRVAGFFFLDDTGWQPDAALRDFVEAPGKPVVISFGSMVHESPERLTGLLLDAIERAGCRAIVQQGWSGLGASALPPHVHVAGFAPHSWLFSKAGCVVHHGGAGTTAATFKAGAPSVVVPHTLDQPMWGEFARALGCASAVIPFGALTAENLGGAIAKAVQSPVYAQAAARVAKGIALENGVGAARQWIEDLVSGVAAPELEAAGSAS